MSLSQSISTILHESIIYNYIDMKRLKYENPLTDVNNRPGKIIDKMLEKTMETCVRAQVLSDVLVIH